MQFYQTETDVPKDFHRILRNPYEKMPDAGAAGSKKDPLGTSGSKLTIAPPGRPCKSFFSLGTISFHMTVWW